jgi:hypothetical protein
VGHDKLFPKPSRQYVGSIIVVDVYVVYVGIVLHISDLLRLVGASKLCRSIILNQ